MLVLIWAWASFTPNSPLFGRSSPDGHERSRARADVRRRPVVRMDAAVLDALRESGARATFFVLGRHVEAHPELVRRISDEGHEIASHGYDHALLTFASQADVERQLERTERSIATRSASSRARASSAHRTDSATRSSRARRRAAATRSWAGRRASGIPPSPASRRSCGARSAASGRVASCSCTMPTAAAPAATAARRPRPCRAIVERAHAAGYELVTVSDLATRAPPGARRRGASSPASCSSASSSS